MSGKTPARGWRRMLTWITPRGWEVVAGLAAPVLLLGALVSGEAILRFEQWRAFGTNQAVETEVDEGVWTFVGERRVPRPNATMGSISFNANGFRGDALSVPKPDGVVRIGFFGSSTTMDPYVGVEAETWPAVAIARLRVALGGCRIEYFNAGVIGYDLSSSKRRFLDDSLKFQPDIAVYLLNDISGRAVDQLAEEGVDVRGYEPSWYAEHSQLWLKLEKNAEAERLKRIASRKDVASRINLDEIEHDLMEELDVLTTVTKESGVLPVYVGNAPRIRREQPLPVQVEYAISRVLYMPNVFIGDITESFYRYNDALRRTAAKFQVPYIETIDRMPDGGAYYADSSHTTPRGSEVFGTIVGNALAASPQVTALIKQHGTCQ